MYNSIFAIFLKYIMIVSVTYLIFCIIRRDYYSLMNSLSYSLSSIKDNKIICVSESNYLY